MTEEQRLKLIGLRIQLRSVVHNIANHDLDLSPSVQWQLSKVDDKLREAQHAFEAMDLTL